MCVKVDGRAAAAARGARQAAHPGDLPQALFNGLEALVQHVEKGSVGGACTGMPLCMLTVLYRAG